MSLSIILQLLFFAASLCVIIIAATPIILGKNKDMWYNNLIHIFVLYIVCMYVAFSLKTILNTVELFVGNKYLLSIIIGLISCICVIIKVLSSPNRTISIWMVISTFFFSFVISVLFLNFDYEIVLLTIHPVILSLLELLGWEFSLFKPLFLHMGEYINLSSTRGNGQGLSASPGSGYTSVSSGGVGHGILTEIANTVHTINYQCDQLRGPNNRFGTFTDWIYYHNEMGNQGEVNRYTLLARSERINIQSRLREVEANITRRSNLVEQAQGMYPNSTVFHTYNRIDGNRNLALEISRGYANNEQWNV